jgi:cell division septation protein DedD
MHGEESAGRTIWRVRVGSFAERADADALLERLRSEEGLEGIVVSHP